MKSHLLLTFLLFGSLELAIAADAYPQPDLLAEPTQLSTLEPEKAKQSIILDTRTLEKYGQGHVPGARWLDQMIWAKEFGDGTDNAGWSKRIGQLGIKSESKVIVYDDGSVKDAARIWWILRYWGVRDVRLLNGGWPGWMSAQNPIETKTSAPVPTEFEAKPERKRLFSKSQIIERLNDKGLQIVDARSEKEFCGLEKLTNRRAGAIPGANQLEWVQLIDNETRRFKSPDELRKIFRETGIDLNRPTATHCQSGGRAAVMAFGMELMGAPSVGNYYASWSEWGNAEDTPVVEGKTKEKKQSTETKTKE